MSGLSFLVPAALLLGCVGLAAFFWSMRTSQYEDLDGAAERILIPDEDAPLPDPQDRPSSGATSDAAPHRSEDAPRQS